MKQTLYIAGPMRGIDDFNYPLFFLVADRLRRMGHAVLNPAENCAPTLERAIAFAKTGIETQSKTFADFFRPDLLMLADAEALVMLPGWRESQGARLEYTIAREMGLPIYQYLDTAITPTLAPLYTVIGISGYARSGKDTIADILVEKAGYIRLAFADVVRDLLYEVNPIIPHYDDFARIETLVDRDGWEYIKREHPAVRELLQALGAGARHVLGTDTWVNACLAKMHDGGKYVISDMRYPNEADAVRRLGGELWRVTRPGVGPINGHESEVALDRCVFDWAIDNFSTVDELRAAALRIAA